MLKMNSDAVAGLMIGGYLLLVVLHGNSAPLRRLLALEGGFVKWAIAIFTISSLAAIKEFKPFSVYIILFVSAGMLLEIERQGQSAVFFEQIQDLMRIKK